jgi:hypothetical protein
VAYRISDRILEKIGPGNYKRNEKGFIADCPVCEIEAKGKGKDKLLISNDGKVHCYRFTGMGDASKEHFKDLLNHFGIRQSDNSFHRRLGEEVSLRVERTGERGRHVVEVSGPKGRIAFDRVKLTDMKDRKRFLASVTVSAPAKGEIEAALVEIAAQLAQEKDSAPEQSVGQSGFIVFNDGTERIAEQTLEGFAIYDPIKKTTRIVPSLEVNGTVYQQWTKGVSRGDKGGVLLPDTVIEYNTEKELIEEIERYIHKYVDLPEFERRIVTAYVMFSYLADKTWELPYLRVVGESGSGKSRLTQVTGMASYRPILVVAPSAASIYRTIEKFHPTLVIDEANLSSQSEDTEAVFQILNAGNQRVYSVIKVTKGSNDKQEVETLDCYGPKVITGLTTTDSRAFESRALHIEMRRTSRVDIPFQLTTEMIDDAARIRGMLTLWRLRNYHTDLNARLVEAEKALKEYPQYILPRFIQIAIPIYAVISDEGLRERLAQSLATRSVEDVEDKRLTMEGVLVGIIHDKLFVEINGVLGWRGRGLCPEGMPCELMLIEEITREYNTRVGTDNPRAVLNTIRVGKLIKQKLHLHSSAIKVRNSENRNKSAVVMDRNRLGYLFGLYGYQMPANDAPDFVEPSESKTVKEKTLDDPYDLG